MLVALKWHLPPMLTQFNGTLLINTDTYGGN